MSKYLLMLSNAKCFSSEDVGVDSKLLGSYIFEKNIVVEIWQAFFIFYLLL